MSCPGTGGSGPHARLRHIIAAVGRLSAHLHAARDDHGQRPAELGRRDIESFLHHLAYLESAGQLTRDRRVRICQDAGRVLSRIRALGQTTPGEPAAGLADSFMLTTGDVPQAAERPEPCRDLPAEIMRALTARLERPGAGLVRDRDPHRDRTADGHRPPPRRDRRPGLRLPDPRRRWQPGTHLRQPQERPRRAAPARHRDHRQGHHPAAATRPANDSLPYPSRQLALLPPVIGNPDGSRPISVNSLIQRHHDWISRMPPLILADGREFDKAKIAPYCYRHTYAQRHADAGIAPDVLRDLMNHRNITATLGYYRIGEDRRREAVDKVAALQFDRHGNRIWREVKTLLDAEHARYAIGEVAVPYGRCAEPSNVAAGGGACPIRFRCAGCDHFRTDVSYLPDLTAYLDDLLRSREHLAAVIDGVDDWARADATPSQEEITRIRRLISQIKGDLAELEEPSRPGSTRQSPRSATTAPSTSACPPAARRGQHPASEGQP